MVLLIPSSPKREIVANFHCHINDQRTKIRYNIVLVNIPKNVSAYNDYSFFIVTWFKINWCTTLTSLVIQAWLRTNWYLNWYIIWIYSHIYDYKIDRAKPNIFSVTRMYQNSDETIVHSTVTFFLPIFLLCIQSTHLPE